MLQEKLMNTELTDEQIADVAGGKKVKPVKICCKYCNRNIYANLNADSVKCKYCGKVNEFTG